MPSMSKFASFIPNTISRPTSTRNILLNPVFKKRIPVNEIPIIAAYNFNRSLVREDILDKKGIQNIEMEKMDHLAPQVMYQKAVELYRKQTRIPLREEVPIGSDTINKFLRPILKKILPFIPFKSTLELSRASARYGLQLKAHKRGCNALLNYKEHIIEKKGSQLGKFLGMKPVRAISVQADAVKLVASRPRHT